LRLFRGDAKDLASRVKALKFKQFIANGEHCGVGGNSGAEPLVVAQWEKVVIRPF
jgi:hypothetical protein